MKNTIGYAMRELRMSEGVNVHFICNELGITAKRLEAIEDNRAFFPAGAISKLEAIFDVNASYFIHN